MSSETATKSRTPEEEEFAKVAAKCIKDCNLESIVTESKFLLADSLQVAFPPLWFGCIRL